MENETTVHQYNIGSFTLIISAFLIKKPAWTYSRCQHPHQKLNTFTLFYQPLQQLLNPPEQPNNIIPRTRDQSSPISSITLDPLRRQFHPDPSLSLFHCDTFTFSCSNPSFVKNRCTVHLTSDGLKCNSSLNSWRRRTKKIHKLSLRWYSILCRLYCKEMIGIRGQFRITTQWRTTSKSAQFGHFEFWGQMW